MVGFLKKLFSSPSSPTSPPLYFKDTNGAFEFACKFLQTELVAKATLPALVVDAAKELGADHPVALMPDGTQMLALRVSSTDGGFLVLSGTLSANGPRLQPGDLVAWHAGHQVPRETPELTVDPRSKWVGLVLAKFKPEYMNGRGWAIEMPFLP